MAYENLQEFLKALEAVGELKRVKAAVDPVLEVAEIADRVSKGRATGGIPNSEFRIQNEGAVNQALLFERVAGSEMPLAINTYGSYKRMQMALGCESFDELAGRIAELTKPEVP